MLIEKYKWQLLYDEPITHLEQLKTVLLKNRGIDASEHAAFLLNEGTLHSPYLFKEMEKAVRRIRKAIENQEKVMVYGDYDVDGVTATAILVRTLRTLGLEVRYYIPNRFSEGYGPNKEAFARFIEEGITLLITVDNGISGVEEAQLLADAGVDLILTDHHEPKETLPTAYATLHPKLEGEHYPYKELSGCGVAFKLACALIEGAEEEYVDLAALGTYADIMEATGENRTILTRGIAALERTTNLGLRMMKQTLGIEEIDESTLGFQLGPRLNAAGRMDEATLAVDLLVTEDIDEAMALVREIDAMNEERKAVIEETYREAEAMIEAHNAHEDAVLVLAKEGWHEGILGIVASRLVENYGKPAIVLSSSGDAFKGSGRSMEGFSLFHALSAVSHLLKTFGGHDMAAGLTIERASLDAFRQAMNDCVTTSLEQTLTIDGKLDGKLLTGELIKLQESLRPYGPKNEQPTYLFTDVTIENVMSVGAKKDHLKLTLGIKDQSVQAIGFYMGSLEQELAIDDVVEVIGKVEENTFMNKTSLQIRLVDLRVQTIQIFDYRRRFFDQTLIDTMSIQPIYFHTPFNQAHALRYEKGMMLSPHVLLIDLPNRREEIEAIMNAPGLSKLYLLLRTDDLFTKEQMMKREDFVRIYAILRKLKRFVRDDARVLNGFKKQGYPKSLVDLTIQVFFELEFVIMEGDFVVIVEEPAKRDLQESETFRRTIEQNQFKEMLTLSTTKELRAKLFSLMNEAHPNLPNQP